MTDFDSVEANYAVAQATEHVIASHYKFTHEDARNRHLSELGFLVNLGGLSLAAAAVFHNHTETVQPFGNVMSQGITLGMAAAGVGSVARAVVKGVEAFKHHVQAKLPHIDNN